MTVKPEVRGTVSLHNSGPAPLVIACADGPRLLLEEGQAAYLWAYRGKLWRRRPTALRTRPLRRRWWLTRGHIMPPLFHRTAT